MPLYVVLQCFQCHTFQAKQHAKTLKFSCVICHQSQTVQKIFAQSTNPRDLVPKVQELNTSRGEKPTEIDWVKEKENTLTATQKFQQQQQLYQQVLEAKKTRKEGNYNNYSGYGNNIGYNNPSGQDNEQNDDNNNNIWDQFKEKSRYEIEPTSSSSNNNYNSDPRLQQYLNREQSNDNSNFQQYGNQTLQDQQQTTKKNTNLPFHKFTQATRELNNDNNNNDNSHNSPHRYTKYSYTQSHKSQYNNYNQRNDQRDDNFDLNDQNQHQEVQNELETGGYVDYSSYIKPKNDQSAQNGSRYGGKYTRYGQGGNKYGQGNHNSYKYGQNNNTNDSKNSATTFQRDRNRDYVSTPTPSHPQQPGQYSTTTSTQPTTSGSTQPIKQPSTSSTAPSNIFPLPPMPSLQEDVCEITSPPSIPTLTNTETETLSSFSIHNSSDNHHITTNQSQQHSKPRTSGLFSKNKPDHTNNVESTTQHSTIPTKPLSTSLYSHSTISNNNKYEPQQQQHQEQGPIDQSNQLSQQQYQPIRSSGNRVSLSSLTGGSKDNHNDNIGIRYGGNYHNNNNNNNNHNNMNQKPSYPTNNQPNQDTNPLKPPKKPSKWDSFL